MVLTSAGGHSQVSKSRPGAPSMVQDQSVGNLVPAVARGWSKMNRREMLKLSSYAAAAATAPAVANPAASASSASVARWDFIELTFPGPSTGNPFLDVHLTATFRNQNRALTVEGFYDGDGTYKARFMPDEMGSWTWTTASNAAELNGKS